MPTRYLTSKYSAEFLKPAGNTVTGTQSGSGGGSEDILYADLVDLIVEGGLIPGRFYTITDFRTTHYTGGVGVVEVVSGDFDQQTLNKMIELINGYVVEGPIEPLIVRAVSTTQLDHRAFSVSNPHDEITYDWNPDNFLYDESFIKSFVTGIGEEGPIYSEPQLVTGFRGVITKRHCLLNDVLTHCDFRAVKSLRFYIDGPAYNPSTEYNTGDVCSDENGCYISLSDLNKGNPLPDLSVDPRTEHWFTILQKEGLYKNLFSLFDLAQYFQSLEEYYGVSVSFQNFFISVLDNAVLVPMFVIQEGLIGGSYGQSMGVDYSDLSFNNENFIKYLSSVRIEKPNIPLFSLSELSFGVRMIYGNSSLPDFVLVSTGAEVGVGPGMPTMIASSANILVSKGIGFTLIGMFDSVKFEDCSLVNILGQIISSNFSYSGFFSGAMLSVFSEFNYFLNSNFYSGFSGSEISGVRGLNFLMVPPLNPFDDIMALADGISNARVRNISFPNSTIGGGIIPGNALDVTIYQDLSDNLILRYIDETNQWVFENISEGV